MKKKKQETEAKKNCAYYLDVIDEAIDIYIRPYESEFKGHDSDKARGRIDKFIEAIGHRGLCVGQSYHHAGIGNNNLREIFVRDIDEDGFIIEKKVALMKYVFGLYGGVYFKVSQMSDGTTICLIDY